MQLTKKTWVRSFSTQNRSLMTTTSHTRMCRVIYRLSFSHSSRNPNGACSSTSSAKPGQQTLFTIDKKGSVVYTSSWWSIKHRHQLPGLPPSTWRSQPRVKRHPTPCPRLVSLHLWHSPLDKKLVINTSTVPHRCHRHSTAAQGATRQSNDSARAFQQQQQQHL